MEHPIRSQVATHTHTHTHTHMYLCYSDGVCIVPDQPHEEYPIRSEVALDELLTVPLVLIRLDFTRHLQMVLDVAEEGRRNIQLKQILFSTGSRLKIALVYPTEHISLTPSLILS